MRCEQTFSIFTNLVTAMLPAFFVASMLSGPALADQAGPVPKATGASKAGVNTIVAPTVLEIVTLEFPPLEGNGPDGIPRGAAVDVVSEIFQALNVPVSIRVYPWTRSLQLVKEGKADAIFTAYRIPEREQFLDYTSEILVNQVVSLYAKTGSPNTFDGNLRDLRGKTIGVVSTISYGKVFDDAVDKYQLKVERVNELQQNLKKLISGRIDYVVSNRYTAQAEFARMDIGAGITELSVPVEVIPSYLAFSKVRSHKDLVSKFDAALRKLKDSGRYKEILARHKVVLPEEVPSKK